MSNKTLELLFVAGLAIAFAVGRYSVSESPVVKIDQTAKTDTEVNKDIDTHVHSESTTVKAVDGTVTTKTTTDVVKETKSQTNKTVKVDTHETVTPVSRPKLNVSALVSYHPGDLKPEYGLSVSKEVLGPITLGAFGLSNGTIGLSLGVNF